MCNPTGDELRKHQRLRGRLRTSGMDQGGQERLKDYSREKLTTLRGEELLPGPKLGADTITVNQASKNQ